MNFLLGNGEKLTRPVVLPTGGRTPTPPYTFTEAKQRLQPQVQTAASALARLPDAACPRDQAVAVLTIHPQYIAKSYHPTNLLKSIGLQTLGSRPVSVRPEKWRPRSESAKAKKPDPEMADAIDLFVAGDRRDFRKWAESLPNWTERSPGADRLFEIERVRASAAAEKIRPLQTTSAEPLLEVVLHIPDKYILESFEAFLNGLAIKPDLDRRYEAGALCFLPVRAPRNLVETIATFSFLRVLREMPKLRPLRPVPRAFQGLAPFDCTLPPSAQPLDRDLRAVIFDGGLPTRSELDPWVRRIEGHNLKDSVPAYTEHGHAVTSAILFGPLSAGTPLPQPYAAVDHVRVLDTESSKVDNDDLFDVLARIRAVLDTRKYQFINLSIGPHLPVEDDDVHAWTVMLDEYLADGQALAAVAVGNSGHLDRASGNARVQVPSDSVNALAVGATDRRGNGWRRATYSSRGPGRSPGLVKPDVLGFGGWDGDPFWLLDGVRASHAAPNFGTSFATPSVLRMALGIRACFGPVLSPLTLRALLIHAADDCGQDREEVGWGRVPAEVEDFVVCPPGMARIVYQGELAPATALRAPVPIPPGIASGKITIHATLCFASHIDPAHPSNYTRSGVQPYFRPHTGKRRKPTPNQKQPPIHASTIPFFQLKNYSNENELRRDAHKWETVLNRCRSFQARTLREPSFDIYYHARDEGQATNLAEKIRYALVVTVRANTPDLYDRVVREYNVLRPLVPINQIPVKV
jgi:hypothetical protein